MGYSEWGYAINLIENLNDNGPRRLENSCKTPKEEASTDIVMEE